MNRNFNFLLCFFMVMGLAAQVFGQVLAESKHSAIPYDILGKVNHNYVNRPLEKEINPIDIEDAGTDFWSKLKENRVRFYGLSYLKTKSIPAVHHGDARVIQIAVDSDPNRDHVFNDVVYKRYERVTELNYHEPYNQTDLVQDINQIMLEHKGEDEELCPPFYAKSYAIPSELLEYKISEKFVFFFDRFFNTSYSGAIFTFKNDTVDECTEYGLQNYTIFTEYYCKNS